MPKFSSRFGYSPNEAKAPVLEDAPDWLRSRYISDVLDDLTYIDDDTRYPNKENRPLGVKSLLEIFCRLRRVEPDRDYVDSWLCNDAMKALLKDVPWYNFFDFVELVSEKLRVRQKGADVIWASRFGLATYVKKVNQLLDEEKIAWRLNRNGELVREIPAVYAKALAGAETALALDGVAAARDHYKKAMRYIYERPLDPENGIKEIISAVESVGKVLYPGTATLGDIVKSLRKDDRLPSLLVTVIEKFYAFANAEPAVRHGGAVASKIQLDDAELCLHMGVALIRYLLSKNNRSGPE